jgi:outer membrane protein OmpA-like peptidoglycan-associated protein
MKTMDRLEYRDIANAKISSRLKQVVTLVVAIIIGMIISIGSNAQQHDFHKSKARFFKAKFRSQRHEYSNACSLLDRKRTDGPKSSSKLASLSRSKHKPMAEIDPPHLSAGINKPKSITSVKPVAVAQVEQKPSEQKLEQLHKTEDHVLVKNDLPEPTSKKHEEIRKKVSDQLKNKKNNEPIELAPLYFNFDQDEFSVVDMDPFLVAVEYALQGRTILIEGHTDSNGKDTYNVNLSIKRVQKIRSLMQDMGVPDDRISVIGYGEEVAKHDNASDAGRQLNRRVDFKAF